MSSISAEKKKRFAGTILTVLMTLMLPIVLIVLLFLTVPKLRHSVFLFTLDLPGYATNFILKQYVPPRQFGKAVPWLERELRLVNWFAPPRNRLLPGLIQNIEYVLTRARFPEEFAVLQPFLEKVVRSHPNLYPARLWLARTLASMGSLEAFEQLKEAIKLSSADAEPFRIAIHLALKNRLPGKVKEWCDSYKKSHFGGLVPLDYHPAQTPHQPSIGLRMLALEIVSQSGKREFSWNRGLRLAENITYDFPFGQNITIENLKLHLGIVPGIYVGLKKIQTYSNGQRKLAFEKDLSMASWGGFHLESGQILTVSKDGEIIFIFPPKEGFGSADRIELTLSFKRLAVAKTALCKE
jgi:hypothetical protein